MLNLAKSWLDAKCIDVLTRMSTRKSKGASHFTEIGIALIIVIVVGIFFKNQIIAWFTSFFGQLTTQTTNLWTTS